MKLESNTTYSERLHLPALGYVQINFYSASALCYELYKDTSEVERQSSIPHLGLIAREYSGSQHTRWEYVALQCAVIDIVDRIHKGNPEIGLGSIKFRGYNLPGSEVLKAWALLSNFGHCRNTFADEKALLNLVRRNADQRRYLLSKMPGGGLTAYTKSIITAYRYSEFHWCLTLLRTEMDLKKNSRKKRPLQEFVRLLKTFDDSAAINLEKLNQLRRMYSLVRKLAIVAIDSRNSHLPINFDISAAILGMDLSEQRTTGESIENVIDPIIGMLTDLLYADRNVLCLMRDYEIQAADSASSLGSVQACHLALGQGLVQPFTAMLRHVHRQVVPVKEWRDIYDERRRSERLIGSMGGVRVQCDDNRMQGKRYLDFLAPAGAPQKTDIAQWIYVASRNLFNSIAFHARDRANVHLREREWWKERLGEEGMDPSIVDRIDQSYLSRLNLEVPIRDIISQRCAAVVSSVMRMLLSHPYSVSVGSTDAGGASFGLQVVRGGSLVIDEYLSEIDRLTAAANDSARKNELLLIRQQRSPANMWIRLACLDRVLVVDTTRPPDKRKVTDIDGLTITIAGSRVRVDLYEAKLPGGGSTNAAKKDLRAAVKPVLHGAVLSGHRVSGYSRGAKLTLVLDA